MPAILVNDVSPVISYVATAAQTLFSVPFEFFDNGDIVVERAGVELTYSPTPANNNQYSVVGANVEGGGSITLGSPGATLGETIVIYRDVPIERLANYPETGPMAVRSLNAEQAKHIAMMQQLERDVNRSVTVPIGESSIDLPSAAERAEKILTFDAAGAPVTDFDIGLLTGAVISSGAAPAQNIEFTATAGQTVFNFVYDAIPTYVSVFLNGVKLPSTDFTHIGTTVTLLTPATVGDRVALEGFTQSAVLEALATLGLSTGAGLVGFSHANTYPTATVGNHLKRFICVTDAPYLAVGDNSTDNTAAFTAALAAAAGGTLYVPRGFYRVTAGFTMPGRTEIVGDGPLASQIYYRTTTVGTNQLFYLNNVDNVAFRNIGLICDRGAGSQETCAIRCDGVSGAVTEVMLDRVDIQSFQRNGIDLKYNTYYFTAKNCRILSTSNAVANGGTGTTNAIGINFGSTINVVSIVGGRISSNDVAIESDTTEQKYILNIKGVSFESNGVVGTPTEYDSVSLRKWSAVNFHNNYMEANLTGTATDDASLKLVSCRGVTIYSCLFACAFGGVSKTKHAIAIKSACYGVSVEGCEFQDPITNYIYVADGNSSVRAHRNYYDNFGTPVVTYAGIMAKMTADLVEIDVPHIEAVNSGSISAGANYQVNLSISGVPLDRNCTVLATLQGGTAPDWMCTAIVLSAGTVRLHLDNIKGSPNTFNGNVVFRIIKNGSF
jgi:hypothetical protein